jgi:competence protein ComEC
LCSDIEKPAQAELIRLHQELRADVVVAPHHGSAATAEPAFLEALAPQIVICSCGYQDYQRSLQRGRLTEAHNQSSRRYYTSESGAVKVSVSKSGEIQVATFRGM